MKTDSHIESLITRHMKSELNEQEFRQLEEWVASSEENLQLFLQLTDEYYPARESTIPAPVVHLYEQESIAIPIWKRRKVIMGIAAGFIGTIIFISVLWLLVKSPNGQPIALKQSSLTVPLGRQFDLTFNDGTVIHANAGTTISYPANYSAENRSVTIEDGEAYFEVAKVTTPDGKTRRPFSVITRDGTIEVTGTHFNVAAYKEQPIRTTLLEGGINYRRGEEIKTLIPGQQAIIAENSAIKITDTVAMDAVIAWQKNKFQFNGATIEEIMGQVSRWYNMKVEYKNKITNTFTVAIEKNYPLGILINRLQTTGHVKFNVNSGERKIVVMN